MGLYARYLLPRLTHLAMDRKLLLPYRQRVIAVPSVECWKSALARA